MPDATKKKKELAERRKAAEGHIDDFLRKVGYENLAERTDEQGWRHVQLESASGRVGVIDADGELFLHVEAIVMPLPADKELLLPLMRELLEINLQILGSARLGIAGSKVHVLSARPVEGLSAEDVAAQIYFAMNMANTLDDKLIAKYGGTSKPRVAPAKPKA